MHRPFAFSGRVRSIRYALQGLKLMILTQHNAWVHAAATAGVVAAGLLLRIGASDWCWLVLAVIAVWTAEALNTAFELLADAVSPGFNVVIGQAKDVAAGAVLITATGAVIIALLIFGPYVLALLR